MTDFESLLTVLLVVLLGVLLVRRLITRKQACCNAPGPTGVPILGNTFQIDGAQMHKQMMTWSKQYGDVFQLSMFGVTYIVINSPQAMYEANVTKRNDFADRPHMYRSDLSGLGKSLVAR